MRGVTAKQVEIDVNGMISTHTPHARRDDPALDIGDMVIVISTHTPHARRDHISPVYDCRRSCYFNSHASCEA